MSSDEGLPLNGFSKGKQGEHVNSIVRLDEEWPDWSDAEEKLCRDDSQPVQISIQPTNSASKLQNAADDLEEPWDDFEDSEVTSDQSPTTTQPSSKPSRERVAVSISTTSSGPERASKALRLTSTVKPVQEQKNTSWDTGWNENMEDLRASKPSFASEPTPKTAHRGVETGKLGEEFTIEVKKKLQSDPELDFFADMVPDIKISSSVLFPVGSSLSKPAHHPASPVSHSEPASTHTVDTLNLTARFAAVDLTEVRFFCLILIAFSLKFST